MSATDDQQRGVDEATTGPCAGPTRFMGMSVVIPQSDHWSRFHDAPDDEWPTWRWSTQGGGQWVRA